MGASYFSAAFLLVFWRSDCALAQNNIKHVPEMFSSPAEKGQEHIFPGTFMQLKHCKCIGQIGSPSLQAPLRSTETYLVIISLALAHLSLKLRS